MVILAICALLLGILYGVLGGTNPIISGLASQSNLILVLLMFSVGISVGTHHGLIDKIRSYHVKILLIPFGIIVGSVLGGAVCSLFLGFPLHEGISVASGMGWYSLSGVAISNFAGAQLGSIAFMSNLMREIFSFFSIPLIAKYFNGYSCIAPAGATSEDTTLPMMIRYTNEETVVLSVINGILCSAAVPVLISLCYHSGL
ncbi:MAG: lysine exporter LysO family protein [Butyricicoccus pullicaecorum]|nr:lysine exporter LysO family protein [Butyricicoccus pullicaecorum]